MVSELTPCSECRQCNHVGKPSVMRGSAYCDSNKRHGTKTVERIGLFQRFKDKLFSRNFDEKENQMKPIKGFRNNWIWR